MRQRRVDDVLYTLLEFHVKLHGTWILVAQYVGEGCRVARRLLAVGFLKATAVQNHRIVATQ